MDYKKIIVPLIVIIVFSVVGYAAINADVPAENANADQKSSIVWSFTDAGEDNGVPQTNVAVVINGEVHDAGKFIGSCSEIGANGGIDGKGLLAGELSAAQCWFAGSGDEVGVFAHEDGGFDIMVGALSEGEEGKGLFRGDFKILKTIEL